jgi:hypothetical protein
MQQIKTITKRLDNASEFDREVNAALAEGWTLAERKVLLMQAQPNDTYMHNMLYAELEKFTEPDETEDSPLTNLIENLAALAGAWAEKAKPKEEPEEEVTPEAERYCNNCKHDSPFGTSTQCESCYDADMWEPKEDAHA